MTITTRTIARLATTGLIVFALAGCATHSRKHNNTLIGAGLGAAGGAVLTQGDPLYTVGGAVAGGVLGNILTEDKPRYGKSSRGRSQASHRNNRRGYDNRHDRRPARHSKSRGR